MQILKTNTYIRDYKKKIKNKHMTNEIETIAKIEELFVLSDNFKEVLLNPLHNIYGISKKVGELREFYTADINSKLRLYLKPIGEYPYNSLEITKIEFNSIDDKHYGDG